MPHLSAPNQRRSLKKLATWAFSHNIRIHKINGQLTRLRSMPKRLLNWWGYLLILAFLRSAIGALLGGGAPKLVPIVVGRAAIYPPTHPFTLHSTTTTIAQFNNTLHRALSPPPKINVCFFTSVGGGYSSLPFFYVSSSNPGWNYLS